MHNLQRMNTKSPCIAAIGMFDGVHRGHQYLLGQLTAEARSQNLSAVVVTFALPPRQILTDKPSDDPAFIGPIGEGTDRRKHERMM